MNSMSKGDRIITKSGIHAKIMELNDKLNRLTSQEVGTDDGSYMPGDPSTWDL